MQESNVESTQQENEDQLNNQSAQPITGVPDEHTPMSGVSNYSSATIQQLASQLNQLSLYTAQQSSVMSQMQQQLWAQQNQQYFNSNLSDNNQQSLFVNVHQLPMQQQQFNQQPVVSSTPMSWTNQPLTQPFALNQQQFQPNIIYPPPPSVAQTNQLQQQQQQQQAHTIIPENVSNAAQQAQPVPNQSAQQSNVQQTQYPRTRQQPQISNQASRYSAYDLKRRDQLLRTAPKYFGNAHENVDVFLLTMRRYFQGANVININEQFEVLLWSLKGKAMTYIQSLHPQPMSTYVLENALRRRFGKTEQQYLQDFSNVKQQAHQSIADYGDALRQVSMGTNLTECAIIHQFLEQLHDKRLIPHLALQNFTHLEQAVSAASILSQKMPRTSKPVNSSTSIKQNSLAGKNSNVRSIKCYHCKKSGHISKDCPSRAKQGKAKGSKNVNELGTDDGDYDDYNEQCEHDATADANEECEGSETEPPIEELQYTDSESDDVNGVDVDCFDMDNAEINAAKKLQDKSKLYNKLRASGVQKGNQAQPPPRTTNVTNTDRMQVDKQKKQLKPKPGAYLDIPNVRPKRPQKFAPIASFYKQSNVPLQQQHKLPHKQVVGTQIHNQNANQSVSNQSRLQFSQQQQQFSKPLSKQIINRSLPVTKSLSQRDTSQFDGNKYLFQPSKSLPQYQYQPVQSSMKQQQQKVLPNQNNRTKQSDQEAQSKMSQLKDRAPVFPTSKLTTKAKVLTNTNNIEHVSTKLLQTAVPLPLDVQIGLLSLSSKQNMQTFMQKCQDKATSLLNQINQVNTVEVCNAQLPVKYNRQTLYIQVMLNNQPVYGLVDTGAQISLITSALVQHLHLVDAEGSNLSQKGHDIIGFNGSRASTNRLTALLTVGTHTTKRVFRQRLHVIESVSYKLILGCDVLYFWQACVLIPKLLLQITTSPKLDLKLFTKDQVYSSREYMQFINQSSPQVNLAEVYEVNTVAKIFNQIDRQEQRYLGQELNEVLVGSSSFVGEADRALPTNTRVSFSPIQPFVDLVDKQLPLNEALRLCKQHHLIQGEIDTLPLRAYNVCRALAENPQLINDKLPYQDQCKLLQVLLDVGDVLAFDLSDITEYADFPPMNIDVIGKPIRQKPYRLTQQDSTFVQQEIQLLKNNNMLQDSSSPWLSPTFVVRPSTHRARMVTDYRKLNAVTIKNAYPLPDILQLFDRLAQSRMFTTLDLKSGFYQIKVADESIPLTAMGTDRGLYQFTVIPFGLANAPSHFMHAINHLIQTEQLQDILEAFVDDLCVHTKYDIDTHCAALRKCLLALRQKKHKVAATKIFIGYTLMKLLGHYIGNGQVSMDDSKLVAIQQLQQPSSIKELRAFLGVVGYYRRFIKNFALKSYHLTQLLKQVDQFTWTADCNLEFQQLKQALSQAPVLALPTPNGYYKLYTDYCSYAMSAILHQLDDNNVERVIQYASKKCQPRESVLSSAEGELLAVVFGLSKFKHYLAGRKFDLITDSAAVTNLKSTRNLNAKMVRWSLLIFDFDFNLIHKSGKKHLNADGLSRAVTTAPDHDPALQYVENIIADDSESEAESIYIDMAECAALQPISRSVCDTGLSMEKLLCICVKCNKPSERKLLLNCETCGQQYHPKCIQQKRPLHYWHCSECTSRITTDGMLDETEHEALQLYLLGKRNFEQSQLSTLESLSKGFLWERGLLYKVNSDNEARIYPGPARRIIIIDELHRRYLHLGANRLYQIASASYYWPNLQQDIKELVAHCLPCQLSNTVFRRRERLQGHLTLIDAPRQGWSIDLAPELTTSDSIKQSIIVCIDDFSSYVKLGIVDKKSDTIANYILSNIIQEYGTPQYIRTDQGTEFFGAVKTLCVKHGITQKYVERAAPWRNGRAERMMRTTKRMIKAVLTAREVGDWPELLPQLQYSINSAPVKSHGFQPFEIFYGEKPPPLIQPHEISGEFKALYTSTAQMPPDQMAQLIQQRRQSVNRLAYQRLKKYQRDLEQQYVGYPIRENALVGEKSICKNALVAIKNTQRGAWQTSGVGPFLVVDVQNNNVTLQSITTGQIFPEAIENVLPLNIRSGLRSKILHNVRL